MSTEKYNFRENDKPSFFNHLLLESERSELEKVTNSEGFDSSQLEVKLELNGVVVRVDDFNKVLEGWGERIADEVKTKVDYYNSEEAVVKKAEELIRDKLGNLYDSLNDIENTLWKLED